MILAPQQCLKRASDYVQKYNEQNAEKAEEIRIGRRTMLIRLVQSFRKQLIDFTAGLTAAPTMYTNRKELARLLGCSEKTVYNQLSFLEMVGVVSKKLHGRQNDFELCLHPYFFFDFVQTPKIVSIKAVQEGTQKPDAASTMWQKLPPISSIETKERINNNYNKGVESVENSKTQSITTPPHFPRHEDLERIDERTRAKQSISLTLPNERTEKGGGGREKLSTLISTTGLSLPYQEAQDTRVKQSAGEHGTGLGNPENAPGDLPKDQILAENEKYAWKLVEKVMLFGMERLWPDTYFSESHKVKIRMAIMDNVFDNCRIIARDKGRILQVYLNAINTIDKSYNYGQKRNYTSYMPALSYFDKKQSKGYFGAQKWVMDDLKRLDEAKKEIYYQKAVYAVTHITHPRNRKDLKDNRLGIATYYQHLIGKRCGAELLNRFNRFLANPKSFT